jgi:4-carboxymuconolactone decarboxylase
MSTPRRRRATPAELTEEQRALYERITGGPRAAGPQHFALTDPEGRLAGPFDALLLSPAVGTALQEVGAAVRYGSDLTDRVRELAILRVAGHWDCAFERSAHEAIGRAVGLSEAEIAAAADGAQPDLADPTESAALAVVEELVLHGNLGDEAYARAVDELGERGVFELTALVGYYATLALQLRVFRADGEVTL